MEIIILPVHLPVEQSVPLLIFQNEPIPNCVVGLTSYFHKKLSVNMNDFFLTQEILLFNIYATRLQHTGS